MNDKALTAAEDKRKAALKRQKLAENLADTDRDIATARAKIEKKIAADDSLKNETMRKTAKTMMEAGDEKLSGLLKERDCLVHDVALAAIDITYYEDLIRAYTA